MPNAAYFQAKAERCRSLLKLAANRQVIDQLWLWISDFETGAARAGRRATSNNWSRRAAWRKRPE